MSAYLFSPCLPHTHTKNNQRPWGLHRLERWELICLQPRVIKEPEKRGCSKIKFVEFYIAPPSKKKRNPWHLENIKVTLGAISRRGTCLCTVLSNRSGKEAGGMREENIGHSCWHLGKHSWCLLPFSPWLHCTGTLEKSQLRSHSRGAQMPPAQYSVRRHSFLFALFVCTLPTWTHSERTWLIQSLASV